MIMEAVKRNVCRGVIFLMACLTCVVVFGSGLIAEAAGLAPYASYTTYTDYFGIYGSKKLVGRNFQANDTFTFKIIPEAGNTSSPKPETVEFKPGAESLNQNEINFHAEFEFTWPGDYVYYISEVGPEGLKELDKEALPGIIYDQTEYKLTVTVSEKEAASADSEDDEKTGQVEQTDIEGGSTEVPGSDNTANGKNNNPATAGGKGEGGPSGGTSGLPENKAPQIDGETGVPAGDEGNVSTEINAIAVMNTGGADDGQEAQKELEVTNVKVEKRSSSGGEWKDVYNGPPPTEAKYCAFTNIYGASIDLTGTKMLKGRNFEEGDTFTFKIEPQNNAPAPVDDDGDALKEVKIQPTSGENSAEIDFGTIYFTPEHLDDGKNEKTFTYTITEQPGSIDGMTYDTAQRTVEIKVTREEDGSMKAEVVSPVDGALSWTNTWKDPDEPGDDPGGDPGNDPDDDPRPSDTSLTVNKEWILDDGGEAPVSVTVELLRNNSVYEEVTLDEDNDWSHTWTGLDGRYNWKVQEADVPDGFTAEVSHHGTIWTITNDDIPEDPETPPEEPDEPDEPDTPEDPVTPDEPDVPDTPDTPDEPNTPNEPTLPQTGQNWRLVWILAITGAVLVLVGILGKKGYHGKHEA